MGKIGETTIILASQKMENKSHTGSREKMQINKIAHFWYKTLKFDNIVHFYIHLCLISQTN